MMRYTKEDEAFLRGLAKRKYAWGDDASTGATDLSYTNMGYDGKRRVDRLVTMGLLAVEDDILVVIEPAAPSGYGLRLV